MIHYEFEYPVSHIEDDDGDDVFMSMKEIKEEELNEEY